MNLILIKYLIGAKVQLLGEPEWEVNTEEHIPDLTHGMIVGINLKDLNNPDKGVEYNVKFGDWVLEGVEEHQLQRSKQCP